MSNNNQYDYLLNTNLTNYLQLNNNTYTNMNSFYNNNADPKCKKITESLIYPDLYLF